MDYDWINVLEDKFEKTKEIGENTLEFTVGFLESFAVVGGTHWIVPTIGRKLWNSYKDDEIHRYLPIDEKDNRARGHVIGAITGTALWTLGYSIGVSYAMFTENTNYLLFPIITNTLSGAWEINRIYKNKKEKKKNLEEISTE